MKTTEKNPFSILLRKVERETSNNCHSEALKMVADFFGYPEYSKFFEELAEKDAITTDEFKERYEASERMLVIIEARHGSDVANKVLKVL